MQNESESSSRTSWKHWKTCSDRRDRSCPSRSTGAAGRWPAYIVALGITATACGDDGSRRDGGTIDASVDASLADTGPTDARQDAPAIDGGRDAGVVSCSSSSITVDRTFEIAPDLGDTQIHANAAFDGEAVWVAFNVPEETGTGLFDVLAVRLSCAGEPREPPFRVNTTVAPNDVDPSIAVGDDGVIIAWTSDDGTGGTDNLDVRYRVFELDGTARMADDRTLETTRSGAPVTGNVTAPFAVALPAGGFALAASRGLPEAMRFQTFVQLLDADGEPTAEATDGFFEPMVTQLGPTLTVAPDGGLHIAWDRDDGSEEQVVDKPVDDGAAVPTVTVPGVVRTSGANLAAQGEHLYLALAAGGATTAEIRLVDLRAEPRTEARFGSVSRLHHSPVIAPSPGGGAVAYYRVMSGIRNEVFLASFADDASGLTAGAPVQVPTDQPAAPYAPALVRVSEDVWLIAWSEGMSPAFRLKARFVRLP